MEEVKQLGIFGVGSGSLKLGFTHTQCHGALNKNLWMLNYLNGDIWKVIKFLVVRNYFGNFMNIFGLFDVGIC